MIKCFLVLLLIFIGFVHCIVGQNLSNREKDGFLGQVRQVNLISEKFSESTFEWKKENKEIITIYDVNGHRTFETEENRINTNGLNTLLTIRLAGIINIFDFNKKGETVVEELKDKDGKVFQTYIFTYDNHGFCINLVSQGTKGIKKETRSEYQYDAYGNWIEQVHYKFNEENKTFMPIARYIRTIYYY